MIKIITSAAVTLMLGAAVLVAPVAPASAANVVIKVGGNGGGHGGHHGQMRVAPRKHCSVKQIVTHRHGKKMVRTVKTCN